jgi:deoxyhypusine synthase
MIDIRKQLEPLELIDIKKCVTVGETVRQMEKAAIGARMIGEAAATIANWVESGKTPQIILDNPFKGHERVQLNGLFAEMAACGIVRPTITNLHSHARSGNRDPIIVLGFFLNEWEDDLFLKGPDKSLFINEFNLAPPWVKDGYFRSFVNADWRFALPILNLAVQEYLSGKPKPFSELFDAWMRCGGVGHQASHGFATFRQMIEDPDCTAMATMSGIMTMAKMGGLISHMIDQKWVQAIAATGALIGHGLVEGIGLKHYKYDPRFTDEEYGKQRLNRITDTIEPEENLTAAEMIIHKVLRKIPSGAVLSPIEVNRMIGKHLSHYYPRGESILRSAFRQDVPVFVPAFWDSELGNDVETESQRRRLNGEGRIAVCSGLDNQLLIDITTGAKNLGIFSLGGGVPRNNFQNVAPLIDIINERLGVNLPRVRYMKGVRICPDSVFIGHLSGCTYSENMSWGKTDTVHGRFSEVMADATMIFPFYMAAMEEIRNRR